MLTIITTIGLVMYKFIYSQNKKLHKKRDKDLSSRYQLEENVTVLKSFIPILIWSILIIGTAGVMDTALMYMDWYYSSEIHIKTLVLLQVSFINKWVFLNTKKRTVLYYIITTDYFQINAFIVDIAQIGNEIIFFWKLPHINYIFQTDFKCLFPQPSPTKPRQIFEDQGDAYFKQFELQWQ